MEECCAFRGLWEKQEIYPPLPCRPYAPRMTDWKTPPDMQERDVASLWARMDVLEDAVLRVVDDEQRDPLFKILTALVTIMAVLQRRILRDERWNRRCARKREMLGLGADGRPTGASEAMRMNMCDRMGGVGALERWQDRARARLEGAGLADGGGSDDGGPASSAGTWKGGREPEEGRQAPERKTVQEFALPRLPSAGGRRRRRGGARSPARHETPIAVWPCEVMPERFRREWWEEAEPTAYRQRNTTRHTSSRHAFNGHVPGKHKPHRGKFPKNRSAIYPGADDCERKRAPP